jgi:Ca-activated chloride channel family protein
MSLCYGRSSLALVLATMTAAAIQLPITAQQAPFRSGTGIVSLFATVVDSEKHLVTDLTKDDFEVFDNDKPQPLAVFDSEVRPITVVVLLDTSLSMTGNLEQLSRAAEQFVLRLLPEDKGRIGAFNDKIEFGGEFTSDRDALISDVKNIDYGNGTRLYDALVQGVDELHNIEGRRVILVFTDGDDQGSRTGMGTAIDRARADEVMVYAIGFQSDYFDGVRMVRTRPDRGLQKLADETGGGYFELKKSADLGPTFSRIALELHSQYVLGFEPAQLDGKVHKLGVRVKKPSMVARARKSYLAAPLK